MASLADVLAAASQHYQSGRSDLAIECLGEALRLRYNIPEVHNNLGVALVQEGRRAEAAASFREAVRLKPDYAEAHNNLGNVLRELGSLEEAAGHLQEAVRLRPDYADARRNLGIVFLGQGNLAEAASSLQQAVRLEPDHAETHFNLGALFEKQGNPAEAEASLRQAVRLKPDNADAHLNLGVALAQQGKLHEAAASFRQALRFSPDSAIAHCNLANALREQGQLEEAVASSREAIRLQPEYAEAHNNLGLALQTQRKLDEAVASYQCALECKPQFAEAWQNLGNVLKDLGQLDEAIAAFRTALGLKPNPRLHSSLLWVLKLHPDLDAQAIYEESRSWNQQHAEPLKRFIRPHANLPDPERRMRIGYVSPDFCEHSCSFFTIPLLANQDHQQCDIYCYADVKLPDSFTEQLRRYADVWRSIAGLSDDQVADLIRGDQIDVLVDLAMHTSNNRLLVFARKPAPVQVAWLAYPGTTGLSTMDYRLTDPYLDPPGLFDDYYSEESLRLPETFWCYDPLTDQPPVNPLPALESGVITFGCLNNFDKVNDAVLALWAQVLRAIPQSRLLLLVPQGQARQRVLARFHQEGIAAERVEFADRVPKPDYLKLYQRMDISLDPFPCNGGTTTLDAFWMGVPTITLLGKTVVGRSGWSLLCNLGLKELAAEAPEQYVALAAQLAADLPRLQELRGTMRQRMLQSPLVDGKRFARHVEEAYRLMWRRWCQEPKIAGVSSASSMDQPISEQGNATATNSVRQVLDTAWKHYQAGQWQQAEQLYLQVLEVERDQVDALHLLGLIAGQTGRDSLAIDYLQAVLRLQPGLAAAHNNLGNVLASQGKLPEAMTSFMEAVRLQPDFAVAHNNLGNALRELGRPAEAVANLQEALRLRPDYAEAHQNLGLAWQAQRRLADAQASFQHAVRLKPDHADAHVQLGVVHGLQGNHAETVASFRQALRFKPDHSEAHFNLGVALGNQGNLDEAEASYQQALLLKPDYAEAHHNLGRVRRDQGRIEEATAAIRSAVQLKPQEACFHSSLLLIFNLNPRVDAKAIYEEGRRWDQRHSQSLQKLIRPHANDPSPGRRLRIGYVSPDFRAHPSSSFTIPLLANHDRRLFEVFCYADVARPDVLTERLRGYADRWRNTVGLSDQQVADLIRGDQIDILVDLAMHTPNNRLLVFARKPVPVQVVWLAYPGTTGLSAMDYRLTDPYLDPPGLFDDFYSEESLRLPETFWCYDPLTDQPPVNPLPTLESGVITFGCLNDFCKVNDAVLALWAQVLRAVPQSRLLLLAPQGQARQRVLAQFHQEGIAKERVEFVHRIPKADYLKLYQRMDIGLDPFPCNGGTTTLDAFWMGVPTITLVGKTVVGRSGWSLLCNLGLKELAAETPEQYVALAAQLAADLPRLQELRGTMRQRMLQSPLMDGTRFARHVEEAYRLMWRRWCERPGKVEINSPEANEPDHSEPHFNLGNVLLEQGKPAEAEASYRQAVSIKPDFADAHNNLGVALFKQGRHEEAAASLQQALQLRGDFAEAHHNLGLALQSQGKQAEAVASLQQAVRLKPDYAEAHLYLGNASQEQGNLKEAEESYRRAIQLKPDYAEAYNNLGLVLWKQVWLEEAIASLQQAVHLKPDYADPYQNLGRVLNSQGRFDDALTAYRKALHLTPDAAHLHSIIIFLLHYHPGYDTRAIYEECRRWNQQHAEPFKRFILPHSNVTDPERRLRIGYISPDFRDHVISFFMVPLLANHDRQQCDIYCYADVARPDVLTERLQGYADRWRNTVGLSDQQVADLIRGDQIDILVDLAMHTSNNRLLVFARKPAPVQVAWLAYPGTTGLSAMDYRLTDPYLDPPGLFDDYYSEESLRLPETFWCYDPLTDQPPVNPLPALESGVITFGCLNNFCKVNDAVLALSAQVLRAVPQSRLLLLAPQGQARQRVLAQFQQEGIAAERVKFADRMLTKADYLKLYQRMDISLDPFPCNGGTTTLDAFWMGIPTITLLGKTVVGRAGWSLLCNLGLNELAAEAPEQYVALAAQLAADLPRLQELRGTMRQRMLQSPLMDGKRFARHVEEAYRLMWRRWCQRPGSAQFGKAITRDGPVVKANKPDEAEAHFKQGLTLAQQGRYEDAVVHYQQALRLKPDSAGGYNNLGNVFVYQGKLTEAVDSFRQAVRCRPHFALAHCNLGNALRELGRLEQAVACLQEALRLQPDYAEAHNNLGIALQAQGKRDEALATYQRALRCKSDFPEAHQNLGNVLKDLGRLDDGITAYRTGLAIRPDAAFIHSNLLLSLHYHPGYDAETIYNEYRRWNQKHAEPLRMSFQAHNNLPDPERKLRIGYVSPHFCDHVETYFTIPLLSNHDHLQFEIFCYDDVNYPDAFTERLKRYADAWRSTAGRSDEQVADLIRGDQIDILADLAMHTSNNRLLVFARKPASVQVAWLAYPGTTGLSAMDYRLTDPYLDPPGLFDDYYSEESLRLPETFWCYDPLTDQPPVNPLPALESGVITFGCLNNFCKVNDAVLALWAQVLRAVPQSRLLLLAPQGQARQRVLAQFQQEGIAAERVKFADRMLTKADYLKLYQRMDISLDPFPCNGGTTTLDAFWMGVPTITLLGKTVVGRAGWSLLCNLGLNELAAEAPEQYVALAAQLAADLPRLQELRGTMRQRMLQSPLMDGKRFARHVEEAYRLMWRRWCQRPGPAQFGKAIARDGPVVGVTTP